jgi:branched-chain amino acid transport system ATP-binding protein
MAKPFRPTRGLHELTGVECARYLQALRWTCKRLSDVGMRIEPGQVYGLIGPNGAGKTTFFNVITGLYTPDTGSFELAGKPYQPTAVHEVAKAGIARTFQNIRLFADMTALENVMVGRHVRTRLGLAGRYFSQQSFCR